MLAYAANRPDPAGRRSSPNVMLFIVAAHVAAIAALMSARMDATRRIFDHTILIDVPPAPPPPPPARVHQARAKPQQQPTEWVDHPQQQVVADRVDQAQVDTSGTTPPDTGVVVGTTTDPVRPPIVYPPAQPVRADPVLLTPASQLRPPYPASKLDNGEEAVLRLRLSVGADGRVTTVQPIGRADPVFLDAARKYLVGHWRYSPATVDGRPVATSLDITLSFQLD